MKNLIYCFYLTSWTIAKKNIVLRKSSSPLQKTVDDSLIYKLGRRNLKKKKKTYFLPLTVNKLLVSFSLAKQNCQHPYVGTQELLELFSVVDSKYVLKNPFYVQCLGVNQPEKKKVTAMKLFEIARGINVYKS